MVVTARPWRHRGELVDLPSAIIAAARASGLTPIERCVALLADSVAAGGTPGHSCLTAT